jgi:hypothetical protein
MDLEDAARQLLERVLIDARVVQRDLNSGVSVHDFDIIRSDESVEALEVTRFTDQKLRALGARLDSFAKSFNTEAIAQRWWVGLTEAVLDWRSTRSRRGACPTPRRSRSFGNLRLPMRPATDTQHARGSDSL